MDVDYETEVLCTALEERLGCILQLIEGLKPEKVLDIGCRKGIISSTIREEFNATVFGIDSDEQELLLAKKRKILCIVSNLDQAKLPFRDAVFDVIIFAETIEHLARPNHALSEIHRVLKPGGIIIITTPNLTSLPNRIKFCLGKDPTHISDKDFGNIHKREYTMKDLLFLSKKNGFSLSEYTYLNYKIESILGFIYKAIACKIDPSLSEFILIKAMKLR